MMCRYVLLRDGYPTINKVYLILSCLILSYLAQSYLISSHLTSPHHVSSHLSSHLMSSHVISSHLNSYHIILYCMHLLLFIFCATNTEIPYHTVPLIVHHSQVTKHRGIKYFHAKLSYITQPRLLASFRHPKDSSTFQVCHFRSPSHIICNR